MKGLYIMNEIEIDIKLDTSKKFYRSSYKI